MIVAWQLLVAALPNHRCRNRLVHGYPVREYRAVCQDQKRMMPSPAFTLPLPDLSAWRAGNCTVAGRRIEGVWQFDSGRPGRHVMISALVHGNEICGAWALAELLAALHRQDDTALTLAQGRLTLLLANLAAFDRFDVARHDASRYVEEDLNRQWLDARLDAPETLERRRAAELRPVVQQADWLLDLHSMHEPCAPLLLTGVHPRNRALARELGAPGHVVIDAGHQDGTRLRDYGRFGLPDEAAPETRSLLIECGFHGDPASRDVARDQCARFLHAAGIVSAATLAAALPGWRGADATERWALIVTEPVIAKSSNFRFVAPFTGLEYFAHAGTLIGDNDGEPVRTPYDHCVLVMPSVRQARAGVTVVRFARREAL